MIKQSDKILTISLEQLLNVTKFLFRLREILFGRNSFIDTFTHLSDSHTLRFTIKLSVEPL